ncbi:GNAT family N-acetyltransferase [Bacillus horti]|uniref:Ribosomal protein S18 acetylase RimI-like enzyme n=1 Tax=Caldalkalibacillus horti TaxID=77523 RepID=A0ABT9VTZ1_9BACI|nr:GNAT family N-acetyltransferase [Bacillus horti]MDQ0164451.1 ribosomal protein S18 acetylase RimI-like enzyme [Bacillus horti]
MIHLEMMVLGQEGEKAEQIKIRNYNQQDFAAIRQIERECYPPPFPEADLWDDTQLAKHVEIFPEGALCAEYKGQIVGSMTTLIIDDRRGITHDWDFITNEGMLKGRHNPNGNTLYVADMIVSPQYRMMGLGRLFMQAVYFLVIELGLERLLGAVRMPGYHKVAEQMSPEEYLEEVIAGVRRDPVITFMLKCGRKPVKVVYNYCEDHLSCNCAVLMEWRNPFLYRKRNIDLEHEYNR